MRRGRQKEAKGRVEGPYVSPKQVTCHPQKRATMVIVFAQEISRNNGSHHLFFKAMSNEHHPKYGRRSEQKKPYEKEEKD